MKQKHPLSYGLGMIRKPNWIHKVEKMIKEENTEYKQQVIVKDPNPRAKKRVGRPRKPFRPGRPRGPDSKLPTDEQLFEAYDQPFNKMFGL